MSRAQAKYLQKLAKHVLRSWNKIHLQVLHGVVERRGAPKRDDDDVRAPRHKRLRICCAFPEHTPAEFKILLIYKEFALAVAVVSDAPS